LAEDGEGPLDDGDHAVRCVGLCLVLTDAKLGKDAEAAAPVDKGGTLEVAACSTRSHTLRDVWWVELEGWLGFLMLRIRPLAIPEYPAWKLETTGTKEGNCWRSWKDRQDISFNRRPIGSQ
jgi:hypothetical protein